MNLGCCGLGSTAAGGSGGGLPAAGPTIDNASGSPTITPAASVATWNISAAPALSTNTYQLPLDAIPVGHIIGWGSGAAPVVDAPTAGGWHLVNPVTGDQTGTTYTYGQGGNGAGESYSWVADIPQKLMWPM